MAGGKPRDRHVPGIFKEQKECQSSWRQVPVLLESLNELLRHHRATSLEWVAGDFVLGQTQASTQPEFILES